MKFKVLGGDHVDGKTGDTYKTGDVFEGHKSLMTRFPNSFAVAEEGSEVTKPTRLNEEVTEPEEDVEGRSESSDEHTEVTESYPAAIKNGLRVFQGPDNSFNVAQEDSPEVFINTDKITSVTALNKFLKAQS